MIEQRPRLVTPEMIDFSSYKLTPGVKLDMFMDVAKPEPEFPDTFRLSGSRLNRYNFDQYYVMGNVANL